MRQAQLCRTGSKDMGQQCWCAAAISARQWFRAISMVMGETRNALVTGAAKRLGRAIALDLARHGWNVAIHYNTSEKEARATCEDARTAGVKVALLKAE